MNNKRMRRLISSMLIALMFLSILPMNLFKTKEVKAEGVRYGYVDVSSQLNVRKGPGTNYAQVTDFNGRIITLYANQQIEIVEDLGSWYKVNFNYNGATYSGYVYAAYVDIYDGVDTNSVYANQLRKAGFPESYIIPLVYLHNKHPYWVFTPYKTNLNWSDALAAESRFGQNAVNINDSSTLKSWLSTSPEAYNPVTDTYTEIDSGGLVAASTDIIAYFLDPRNFLTESGIFMFEKLTYHSAYHNEAGVQNILNNSFMAGTYDGQNTYASLFMKVAQTYSVSPYMLATRARQEQGAAGTSGSVSGTVDGYRGIYNYFNIGAYRTAEREAVKQGLYYASQTDANTLRPWNTIYKSIMGGGSIIANSYINKGQNSLYLQKFNVTPTDTYNHEYMTNVDAPSLEAYSQRSAYSNLNVAIEFSIPVFNNMPVAACDKPTAYGNNNAEIKTIMVNNIAATYKNGAYYVTIPEGTAKVTISVATSAAGASVLSGAGIKNITSANTDCTITVRASDGTTKNHKLHIYRPDSASVTTASVKYGSHVQTYGWMAGVSNGEISGTLGQSKRLEAIQISVSGANVGIQYTTHIQTYGWTPWCANGEVSGSTGEGKRLEAIKIKLTGADKDSYDVYYRVHAQSYGWLNWAKNGEPAGTSGYAKRLEAIQIVIVPKGAEFNRNIGYSTSIHSQAFTSCTSYDTEVPGDNMATAAYRTYVQSQGWTGRSFNGKSSGSEGKALRMEGFKVDILNKRYSGGVRYKCHVQDYGWETNWVSNGNVSGRAGSGKRLEAIKIELTNGMAEHYDIYYRVHSQTYGWLDWAKNGEEAGTTGLAKRVEAIQIVIVEKDAPAPGKTDRPLVSK